MTAADRRRFRARGWRLAAILAVLMVIAADSTLSPPDVFVNSFLDPASIQPGFGPRTSAEALAEAERGVAGMRERLARHPGDWLPMEGLARALMTRQRHDLYCWRTSDT